MDMDHPVECWKRSMFGLMLIAGLLCYYWSSKIPVTTNRKMMGPIKYEKPTKLINNIRNPADIWTGHDTRMEPKDVPVVLLMTYMRSGSTLLGDIVQQLPNVLYSYEPLKRYMAKGYFLSREHGSCYTTKNICRTILRSSYRLIIDNIKNFFQCDSQKLDPMFLKQRKSKSWLQLCPRSPERKQCMSKVIRSCKSAVRIIKTIRLSMDVVQELMENLPNLKVIHLLRDPRGMIVSRLGHIPYLEYNSLSETAQAVCERYNRDIRIGQSLKAKYPNRIKTLLYEQIAQKPLETSTRIFKFLGLQPKNNFKSWLVNHTTGDPNLAPGHPAFSTVRSDPMATSNSWRLALSLQNIMDIDRKCSRVYEYTGYMAVNDINILSNFNISVRKENTNFP